MDSARYNFGRFVSVPVDDRASKSDENHCATGRAAWSRKITDGELNCFWSDDPLCSLQYAAARRCAFVRRRIESKICMHHRPRALLESRSRGYTSRKHSRPIASNFDSLCALMSAISVLYAVRPRRFAPTYFRDPEGSFVHQSQSFFSPIPRGVSWLHSTKYRRALHG